MVKTKTKKPAAAKKPAAKKRGRAAAAKTTKTSKAPSSVCPYARAEFYIEGGGGDSGWNGEEMYSGGHPATSVPECGKLLQFKFPRKWLDIDAKNFEYYTFCFVLHLKKKNKNKSGADDRVGTRTQVINGDDREVVDSVREHFQARLRKETTAEYAEGTWVGRGDASTVRIAMRRKPRQNWKYQIKFLEASLQLGADGTVPESEFGPGPGEEGYDSDSGDESAENVTCTCSGTSCIRVDGICYDEYMAQQGCDPTTGQRLGEAQGV